MVQGAHALSQMALECPMIFHEWGNQPLIFLGVHTYKALTLWRDFLTIDLEIDNVVMWYEPDLDNQLTAIAIYGHDGLFTELPLA
jgi:hypothetical protein